MKSKIRILVTHQVHFLKDVSRILYLDDGEIKFKGNYQELLKSGMNMALSINNSENEKPILNRFNSLIHEVESSKLPVDRKSHRQISENSAQAIQDEKISDHILNIVSSQYLEMSRSSLLVNTETKIPNEIKSNQNDDNYDSEITNFGLINWKTYFVYFKLGSGVIGAAFNFIFFIIAQFAVVGSDYWVSNW